MASSEDQRVAVFDRDGTVIVERHYLSRPEDVELLPGAAAGMRRLQDHGYRLIIATNQSAIARGYVDTARLSEIHQRLLGLLGAEGVSLSAIYYCPHHPQENCPCRKPQPGMLLRASRELDFDPARAVVFGDKPCDIEMGRAVGATTTLVATGYGREHYERGYRADYYVSSLAEGASALLRQRRYHHEMRKSDVRRTEPRPVISA